MPQAGKTGEVRMTAKQDILQRFVRADVAAKAPRVGHSDRARPYACDAPTMNARRKDWPGETRVWRCLYWLPLMVDGMLPGADASTNDSPCPRI